MTATLLDTVGFMCICAVSCIFFILFISLLITYLRAAKMDLILRFEEEKFFSDFSTDQIKLVHFPNISDDPSIFLSVIVPAYNEEMRLPAMLDECMSYLNHRFQNRNDLTYEVIIVDDGSSDDTTKVAKKYVKQYGSEKCRVLTLVKNRGKGGAVRLGMVSARGKYLLFADADGATKFGDIEKLEKEMQSSISDNPKSIVIGSRAHLEKDAIASRSFFRTVLMYGFHFLVWLLCVRTVRDTQCGFKLFTREAAKSIFLTLHVERWAFDVELLYIAEKMNMNIKEVAVNWTEIEGSKLVPFWSWLQMGIDLLLIWWKYQTGLWKITDTKKCD